ncbi:MAG: DUF3783 domain-containing protein [Clostridia bacterium]|nr:DUF3783 domain-containing protein [Clostridia bacterium]
MASVLLFNFTDEKRSLAVKAQLFRLSIACRDVAPADQRHPLGFLLGLAEYGPGAPAARAPFADEMLVMHDLSQRQFHGLLDGMKQAGIQVPLKAVITPHNVGWTAERLHSEIRSEHEAMRNRPGTNERFSQRPFNGKEREGQGGRNQ